MIPSRSEKNIYIRWNVLYKESTNNLLHELPQSYSVDNREGTFFSRRHVYYAHLCVVDHLRSVTPKWKVRNY